MILTTAQKQIIFSTSDVGGIWYLGGGRVEEVC